LLVCAVIFVFGIKGGVGIERIAEFFQRVRLAPYVGGSPTALGQLLAQMEEAILAYQIAQEARWREMGQRVDIIAGVDETFFDQVVLVMMD
jgi:hypothetical protein